MTPFAVLSTRGQVARLRRLALVALASYEVRPVRISLLAHVENTTFRVDTADGARYMLRVHRTTGSPFHPCRDPDQIRSELLWLLALRRGADLAVPEPVLADDGSLVRVVGVDGVAEPRACVLLRWVHGRFVDAGLTPSHLARVGRFMAQLHIHSIGYAPPAGFTRHRVGEVSDEIATHVTDTIADVGDRHDVEVVATVLDRVRRAHREVGESTESYGLIHGDLHQENYLFRRDRVGAIDFDDCGWGPFLFDFAVPLSELTTRPDHAALRAGLLRGYREVRPVPDGLDRSLPAFLALRELQLTLWFLEQRDHPAFAAVWANEVRAGLQNLRRLATALDSAP